MELRLDPESNPELKSLWNERVSLAKEWTELNLRVLKYPRRTIWFGGVPKSLLRIGQEMHSFEKRWIDWDDRARSFSVNPRMTIEGHEESHHVTFLHYTGEFRWMIAEMNSNMRLIQSNYNLTCQHFFNQRNLVLSWLAIILAILFGILAR